MKIKLIILMICILQSQIVIAEDGNKSFKECENIPDAMSRQFCLTKQHKNITNCYLISDADRQRMCLAYFENNKSHCLMIEDDNKKQQCLSNF